MEGPSMTHALRRWQEQALAVYWSQDRPPQDFLVHATPGAGKTRFAGELAQQLRQRRWVDRIIVVTPTDHLRRQWAAALAALGLDLAADADNALARLRPDAAGAVVTYAQVASKPAVHRARATAKRSLILLDEIHHCGDAAAWGEAVAEAFDPARLRVGLTGTPFRSAPGERIPFVQYDAGDEPGELVCRPDVSYGYAEALADGVVRPVVFAAYSGTTRWAVSEAEAFAEREAVLGEAGLSRSDEDAAWRTALDPAGQWVRHVLAAMDDRINYLRANGMPRAAGLVLAADQDTARGYAAAASEVLGIEPVVILSDDPDANRRIAAFERGDARLAVAVRMISEGVDIPRVAVIGYLSRAAKELIWQQSVGRALRKSSPRAAHEVATVFLPAVRPLLDLAARMEEERNHVVRVRHDDLTDIVIEPAQTEAGLGEQFVALGAEASFGHVLHAGRAVTGDVIDLTEDYADYLGLPGLLSAEQTATLLATRDAEVKQRIVVPQPAAQRADVATLRREVAALAAQVASRTGSTPRAVHVQARRAVPGPASAQAPLPVLRDRRDWLLAQL
jgi:superfamily II DNA or RNA helicase